MAYTFSYVLVNAPEARRDGSGAVSHLIQMHYTDDGEDGGQVGGRAKTVVIPPEALTPILAMPDGTGPERQAKNQAYKQALVDYRTFQPTGISGWEIADVTAYLDANKVATQNAADADDYITDTLGQSYPLPFNL